LAEALGPPETVCKKTNAGGPCLRSVKELNAWEILEEIEKIA